MYNGLHGAACMVVVAAAYSRVIHTKKYFEISPKYCVLFVSYNSHMHAAAVKIHILARGKCSTPRMISKSNYCGGILNGGASYGGGGMPHATI